jgi:glycine/D-amino acid oxidase-like deaminating enzyme
MKRRLLLAGGLAAGGFVVLRDRLSLLLPGRGFDTAVHHPGQRLGHRLRELTRAGAAPASPPPVQRKADVVIVGSGVAALSCAWALRRAGLDDFVMIDGPAPLGNAAWGTHAFSAYPRGAHYLPVPTPSSQHVREMLHDLGVLLEGRDDDAPLYDERCVVHANVERVLHQGRWHAGILPPLAPHSAAHRQWAAVQAAFGQMRALRDAQGRAAFEVPLVLGGAVPSASRLDAQSFAAWLDAHGVTDPLLRWYFDYCCRDEYGVEAALVSAWAGVHYFCVQRGQARHAEPGAVLTWPQGLGWLAQGLQGRLAPQQRVPGAALQVSRLAGQQGCRVTVLDEQGRLSALQARKVVVATPLFIARRLVPEHFDGLQQAPGPAMSPWMVANFFMRRFPAERPGELLSWDNVVSGSSALGYIVATHQAIRTALPAGTVLTAYHALGAADPDARRRWAAQAPADELLAQAGADLDAAYGSEWKRWCAGVELTVHGHAMAVPAPGFLREPLMLRARAALADGQDVLFAHADLSGYSVFEEASYWGVQAARAIAFGLPR